MTTGTTRPLRGADHEILQALRLHGPATRAELVTRTGLSRATVSAVSARLLADDRVENMGTAGSNHAVGRTPERLALSVSGAVILGIEFGHRRVTVTAMNEAHHIEGSATTPYEHDTPWSQRVRHAFTLMNDLSVLGSRAVIGVGLGVPGRIPDRESITRDLVTTFASRVCREVRVDNNARLAGLAESVWGAGRGLQSFVYLRLMDGVGGTLITRDTIYDGLRGTAGEFGHMTIDPAGPECRCGKRGCLEAYVSRERILAATSHRDLDSLHEVLDAGDRRRQEIVKNAGRRIGTLLANVCTALDVEGVVLGGDLLVLGRHLTAPLEASFAENLMPSRAHRTSLHTGQIRQVDGALGGIALVLRDHTIALPAPAPTVDAVRDQKGRLSS